MAFIGVLVFVILFLLVFLFAFYPRKNNVISINKLNDYISSCLKKRKMLGDGSENTTQNAKINQNYCLLKKSYVFKKFSRTLFENKIYVEKKNHLITKKLKKTSKEIDKKINLSLSLYRSYNGECLIETIASSFASAVVTQENFNMFSCFKNLASINKIYKKEAEILNILASKNLIELYIKLQEDINNIKRLIKKGKRAKKLKKNLPAFIYGAYMFNPLSTKLFVNNKNLIIKSVNALLDELDEICLKQRIIYNYVAFLMK